MATILPSLKIALEKRTIEKVIFEPCKAILHLDNGEIVEMEAVNKQDELKLHTNLNVKMIKEYDV
ncbi:hypothetical protein SMD22_01235 (plasmid) [Brevibacillus halotolerans]|nr:hypothetical protein SMD22_01235 [Brevibacillus halotolerans]